MFQIPQCVLENLKCALCDGYLTIKPLMIKPDGEQICGNCTEIIPIEEKEKCLRQIGLETLAQLFVFPCRYHRQGCKHRFAWNTDNSHEEICPYRYRTSLSSMPSRSSREFDHYNVQQGHVSDLNGMISDFTYDFKNDDSGPAVPPYENARKYQNDNDLLAADTSIQRLTGLVYDEATNNIVEENMYEALGNKSARQCSTCKAVVDDDVYTCLFGHLSCINCKRNMCKMCVNLLEKDSKTICKNYNRGCKNIFNQCDLNKHQNDCPYNDHKCPFENCKFKSTLMNLKLHLEYSHHENVIMVNEVTRTFQNKDDVLVFLCYEGIFKCVYFYYKAFVEFFVTYIGPSDMAVEYVYELSVQLSGHSLLTKKSQCSSWNDSMLEKGISFDRKDLIKNNEKKINFEIRLRILYVK